MIAHKGIVRKRIAAYLQRAKRTDVLLKDVDRDFVSGLFDYIRSYRNHRHPGKLPIVAAIRTGKKLVKEGK